jgi:hypothetical protein
MDAWSKITHHKYCFLVPRSLTSPSDVQSATMHDTQRKCTLNIHSEHVFYGYSEQFSRGTGRKHLAASPVPAVLRIGDASERPSAFSELHHRVPACRAAMVLVRPESAVFADSPRI